MAHGNYGSGREPVLSPMERVAITASQQEAWAVGQVAVCEGKVGAGGTSAAYMRGFRDAMQAITAQIERTKESPDGAAPLTGDALHWALYQLRLVEIELGGWIERADLPADMAKDMSERMQRIMEATKGTR